MIKHAMFCVLLLVPASTVLAVKEQGRVAKGAAQHAVPGWYLGLPVLLEVSSAPPGSEPELLSRMRAYVTAPVNQRSAAAPYRDIPRQGGTVVLPPHQITLVEMPSEVAPKLAVGYFVQVAPEAPPGKVKFQPQPENSWPLHPLASAILVGDEWVALNNQVAIEYGIAQGLLQLQYFDVGGLMSARYFNEKAASMGAVTVKIPNPAKLPPVDWESYVDRKPGEMDILAEDESVESVSSLAEKGAMLAKNCAACHGRAGISENEFWPNLAGQQPGYLREQISAFRDGRRSNPLMDNWVQSLSDHDVGALAAYYSGLAP
tara:strand:- start:52427 stop:53377 length:951 start_codon:yes stop_codon:yes gene_type:complete